MIPFVILVLVFRFINLNDLARAAGACFEWWRLIKRHRMIESGDWEDLDLSGTGKLYCFIPRRTFRSLTRLNLASTQVSNHHFQQMMRPYTSLEILDISNCPALDQISIFQAKESLRDLQRIVISGNTQFTIMAIACLCSCPEIVSIEAHGLKFSAEELLFLSKTFESVGSGNLELETADGYNPLYVMNTFERELFQDWTFILGGVRALSLHTRYIKAEVSFCYLPKPTVSYFVFRWTFICVPDCRHKLVDGWVMANNEND